MKKYTPIFWDIETTGTNPIAEEWHNGEMYDARITAVGIGWLEEEWRRKETEIKTDVIWDEDEYNLLKGVRRNFKQKIKEIEYGGNEAFIVSYNGRKFDHPYIASRYARYRQRQDYLNNNIKRLDMMRLASKEEYGNSKFSVSQDEYAEKLGIEVEDETTGKDMPEYYENKEWKKIEYHCREDIKVMVKIFLEKKQKYMEWFYNHYDINKEADFTEEVEF